LYFIDTQSHLITETITLLDTQPVALDYSPIDNSLYIVSAFSGSVTVVDLEGNQISQLPFSQIYDGRDVVVAPGLRRIYVLSTTEGSSSNLYILDMDSGEVLNESTIGGNAIVIDETAELIFTVGHNDGELFDTFYKYSISDDRPERVQSTRPESSGKKIAISPDGAHLVLPAGSGNGGGYTIYDFDASNLQNVLGEWDVGIYPSGAAFSPDGSVFFGTNGDFYDNYLYVMDAVTYRQIRKLRFPNADDYAVFTPNSDGTVVVGFSYDSYYDSGHGLYFFTDVQNESTPSVELKKISDMVAGKDPHWVYAVDQDNQALYYINTQTQQIADTLVLPDTQPVAIDYSSMDNSLYVVSAFSGDVTIVHLDDNQISKMPFSINRDGRDIVVAPTLRRIYVLSPDGYDSDLSILDMDNGDVLSLTGIGGSSIVIDESSEVIFTANRGLSPATLYKYSVSSDQQKLLQSIRTGGNGKKVAISPDGAHVVLPCGGGNGPGYTIYDFDAGNLDNVFGEWDVGTYPTGAAFSPDGSIFFGINGDHYDNHLYVMDAAMYSQIRKLPFANSDYYAVITPNSDGSVVVGFSYDK
jgi:DNA-binding beta-propeller fold protein YncE